VGIHMMADCVTIQSSSYFSEGTGLNVWLCHTGKKMGDNYKSFVSILGIVMFNPSKLICASCEELVIHQNNIPIPLHRNSECCAHKRNAKLEITTVDTLNEWYPRRDIRKISHAVTIC